MSPRSQLTQANPNDRYHVINCTKGRKGVLYLTTHSTHYLWLYGVGRIVEDLDNEREETLFRHFIDYSFRLAAMDLLYARWQTPELCYTIWKMK